MIQVIVILKIRLMIGIIINLNKEVYAEIYGCGSINNIY